MVKPAELEKKTEGHPETNDDESKRFNFGDFQKMVDSFSKFNPVARIKISKPKELPIKNRKIYQK